MKVLFDGATLHAITEEVKLDDARPQKSWGDVLYRVLLKCDKPPLEAAAMLAWNHIRSFYSDYTGESGAVGVVFMEEFAVAIGWRWGSQSGSWILSVTKPVSVLIQRGFYSVLTLTSRPI